MKFIEVLTNVYLRHSFNCWRKWLYILRKWIAIAVATLSNWLKRLTPVFQPMRSKIKTNRTMYAWFFPRLGLSELQIIARNCDWFMELFVPVVIGGNNCFGFGFPTVIWKPLYHSPWQSFEYFKVSWCWKSLYLFLYDHLYYVMLNAPILYDHYYQNNTPILLAMPSIPRSSS